MPSGLRGTNQGVTRIGLVLGAGGVTGDAFHRGLLRALSEVGYDARSADVIVGTSAGSMVGAFLPRPDRPLGATLRDASVHGQRLGAAPDLSPLLAALRQPWRARPGVIATSLLPTGRRSTDFLVADPAAPHRRRRPGPRLPRGGPRRTPRPRVAGATPLRRRRPSARRKASRLRARRRAARRRRACRRCILRNPRVLPPGRDRRRDVRRWRGGLAEQ